ncbi:MAG TPA: GNAT family protein [Pyrinomonadaceae bacterium]|nr:GNAT family protein [Pyrinomonadaceae bacterium]
MDIELTDGSVGIRRFRADDARPLYEAVRESLPELLAWMPWAHPDYAFEESLAWVGERGRVWDEGTDYACAVFEPPTGRFLGVIGLNKVDRIHMYANLGYWVRSGATRRGVASTAARLMARLGLGQLGFQRLEIVAAVGNRASQRVAEKAGAKREGVLRKGLRYHGVAHDAVLYSLVAEDLEDLNAAGG